MQRRFSWTSSSWLCFSRSSWPQLHLEWASTSLMWGLLSTTPSASPSRTTTRRADVQVDNVSLPQWQSASFRCPPSLKVILSVRLQVEMTSQQTASSTLASLMSSGSALWLSWKGLDSRSWSRWSNTAIIWTGSTHWCCVTTTLTLKLYNSSHHIWFVLTSCMNAPCAHKWIINNKRSLVNGTFKNYFNPSPGLY